MQIDANTKLNSLFKFHKEALDRIVSLNEKFEKLRNPLLRKIMAPRTTISMAAKIGGCRTDDFFDALRPLGFTVSNNNAQAESTTVAGACDLPKVSPQNIFDVRPILSSGKDPLKEIIQRISLLNRGETLCIINSFEPVPLVSLLKKKGCEAICIKKHELEYHTFFTRTADAEPASEDVIPENDWEEAAQGFQDHFTYIDVREMAAPQPMVTILEQMERLPKGSALYVYHKRVPLYLLPEISDRGFEYRINERAKDEVHLIIFQR